MKECPYLFLLECCQYNNDIFWKNIFENLAYGKAPYGTYISKDFLCCSYKKREFSYKLDRKEPQVLYNDIKDLLSNKLGLVSTNDRIRQRCVVSSIESVKSWSSIRKKNIKELLIELFVIDMKMKYSLSIIQARYLISIIYIAMIFKVIKSEDINYSNGKIHAIDGIDFSDHLVFIDKDLYNIDTQDTIELVFEKKNLSEWWNKFIKNISKTVKDSECDEEPESDL